MSYPFLILIVLFIVLLFLNVPIVTSIALSSFAAAFIAGGIPAAKLIAYRMATGVESFALLSIPFFILSGYIMGRGGMSKRLINFASALVGPLPGGLALVNILTCMLFGSISGSAVAAVSSIGSFMLPEMNKKGYDRDFNIAVTTSAATTGLLIPPSNVMIVYCLVSGGVSVGAIFMAGILPGLLTGLSLMIVAMVISIKRGYKGGPFPGFKVLIVTFFQALPSMLMIVIILAGILSGIFTATEAAAIAVVYSLFLTFFVYREINVKDIIDILIQGTRTTAIVMMLIGASMAMSWVLAYQNIPEIISRSLLGLTSSPWVLFILFNLVMLFIGTFMDMTPAIMIFTPIFLPTFMKMGIHPVHFGIVMIANLNIGLCTPPVGSCLFVGCGIGKSRISRVSRAMVPFFIAMLIALLLITYIPAISLFLPKALGLI